MILKSIAIDKNIALVYESHESHESIDDSAMDDSLIESIESDYYGGNKAAWFDASVSVWDSGIKTAESWLCSCNYGSFQEWLESDSCSDLADQALHESLPK